MNDENLDLLLENLLNLKPHQVENISYGSRTITVTLSKPEKRICPTCGSTDILSKGFYTKSLKLCDHAFDGMNITVRVPRMYCLTCGHSFSDRKHMNPLNHTISYDVVQNIMNLLLSPAMTFRECAAIVGVSESTVARTFDKYCHLSKVSFPEAICIDEVYTPLTDYRESGSCSKYSCLLYDFYREKIIDVLPSRTSNCLTHYFESVSEKELKTVKYVVMDLYPPYREIVHEYMKKALICADSFHLVKMLNECFAQLRNRIMNRYDSLSQEYYLLRRWNYLLFLNEDDLNNTGKYNVRLKRVMNYRQLRDAILQTDEELFKAWELLHLYMKFNQTCAFEDAYTELNKVTEEFSSADIPEYRPFVTKLLTWKKEIINSFIRYRGRRLNNGVAEGINARVSTLLFNTRGIRDTDRRKKRIMYSINKETYSL